MSSAWPIASTVNLENIVVEEFSAKRSPEGHGPNDDMAIAVNNGPFEIGNDPVQKKLFLKIPFTLRAAKKTASATAEPSLQIKCQFVLVYAIEALEGLTDHQFAAFAANFGHL